MGWSCPGPLLTAKSCKFSLFLGYISQSSSPLDTRPPLFTNPGSDPGEVFAYHTYHEQKELEVNEHRCYSITLKYMNSFCYWFNFGCVEKFYIYLLSKWSSFGDIFSFFSFDIIMVIIWAFSPRHGVTGYDTSSFPKKKIISLTNNLQSSNRSWWYDVITWLLCVKNEFLCDSTLLPQQIGPDSLTFVQFQVFIGGHIYGQSVLEDDFASSLQRDSNQIFSIHEQNWLLSPGSVMQQVGQNKQKNS